MSSKSKNKPEAWKTIIFHEEVKRLDVKFKDKDIILTPLFKEVEGVKYFAEVSDSNKRICRILPQAKIKDKLEFSKFFYVEDASDLASEAYRELYPENNI